MLWIQIDPGEADKRGMEYIRERIDHYRKSLSGAAETKYREAAKKAFEKEADLEFDESATVSISGDGGAYVACWKWIGDAEAAE